MKNAEPVGFGNNARRERIPESLHPTLLPVAKNVFWWGEPAEWMDDAVRFTAQVMVFGDWNDTTLTWELLGDKTFREVLAKAPPGVFDIKSWTYWHCRFGLEVPCLPQRFGHA